MATAALAQISPRTPKTDSISLSSSRTKTDTIPSTTPSQTSKDITYADDALDAEIQYYAKDSTHHYVQDNIIHLFGKAKVSYQDFNVTAAEIIFDRNKNTITAKLYKMNKENG